MPSEVSRISVPALDNWQKVQQNITNAILAALDEELGPGRGKERRGRVEGALMEWKDRVFELAGPNLRVGGVDFEELPNRQQYKPFDEALSRQLQAMREQQLVTAQTLAQRRRTVPHKVQELLSDLLERQRMAEMPLAEEEESEERRNELEGLIEQAKRLQIDGEEVEERARGLNETVPKLLQRAQWAQEVSSELSSSVVQAPTYPPTR